jgi:hypothetical protein
MDHIGEKHVTDTHFFGGPKNAPGKSTFDEGVDPYDLVDDAANFPARSSQNRMAEWLPCIPECQTSLKD